MTQSIAEQDNHFQQEVALFNKYHEKSLDFCEDVCTRLGHMLRQSASRPMLMSVLYDYEYFAESIWDSAFNVSGVDCIIMRLGPVYYRRAQKVHLFPEICTQHRDQWNLRSDTPYCSDYFGYSLPWSILYKPFFVTPCHEVTV